MDRKRRRQTEGYGISFRKKDRKDSFQSINARNPLFCPFKAENSNLVYACFPKNTTIKWTIISHYVTINYV